jgi:hypothetical protein
VFPLRSERERGGGTGWGILLNLLKENVFSEAEENGLSEARVNKLPTPSPPAATPLDATPAPGAGAGASAAAGGGSVEKC